MAKIAKEFTFADDEQKEHEVYFIQLGSRGNFVTDTLRIYDDGTARFYGTLVSPEYLDEDGVSATALYPAELVLQTDVDVKNIVSASQILNSNYKYGELIVLKEEDESNV